MSMTDPISDLLTRVRNGNKAKMNAVDVPASNVKREICRILKEQGLRPRPHNFVLQPLRQFYWRYVTLGGYQDGWHGLRLSLYMMYYEWVKYRKLAWFWRKERGIH